jgi:hypothetical protein
MVILQDFYEMWRASWCREGPPSRVEMGLEGVPRSKKNHGAGKGWGGHRTLDLRRRCPSSPWKGPSSGGWITWAIESKHRQQTWRGKSGLQHTCSWRAPCLVSGPEQNRTKKHDGRTKKTINLGCRGQILTLINGSGYQALSGWCTLWSWLLYVSPLWLLQAHFSYANTPWSVCWPFMTMLLHLSSRMGGGAIHRFISVFASVNGTKSVDFFPLCLRTIPALVRSMATKENTRCK